MTDIVIGPFSFPATLLLLFAAMIVALAVGNRLARGEANAVERSLWLVAGLMVLGARAVFVLRYQEFYLQEPLRMLDIRDGGFAPAGGLGAAIAAGAWLAWKQVARRKALLAALAAGCVVWGGGTLALSLAARQQALPELELAALDGGTLRLADLRGRPVVINLWASWCPPCRREMPVLAQAQQAHPGVAFVFANQGEPQATVTGYLGGERLSLRNVVLDHAGALAQATGSHGLPTTLFYDARGKLVERRMGELSAATLAQRLELLRGDVAAADAAAAAKEAP